MLDHALRGIQVLDLSQALAPPLLEHA